MSSLVVSLFKYSEEDIFTIPYLLCLFLPSTLMVCDPGYHIFSVINIGTHKWPDQVICGFVKTSWTC